MPSNTVLISGLSLGAAQILIWLYSRVFLPPMRKTWVQSLGREDPLEEEMATHSGILDWRIPWIEETGGL